METGGKWSSKASALVDNAAEMKTNGRPFRWCFCLQLCCSSNALVFAGDKIAAIQGKGNGAEAARRQRHWLSVSVTAALVIMMQITR